MCGTGSLYLRTSEASVRPRAIALGRRRPLEFLQSPSGGAAGPIHPGGRHPASGNTNEISAAARAPGRPDCPGGRSPRSITGAHSHGSRRCARQAASLFLSHRPRHGSMISCGFRSFPGSIFRTSCESRNRRTTGAPPQSGRPLRAQARKDFLPGAELSFEYAGSIIPFRSRVRDADAAQRQPDSARWRCRSGIPQVLARGLPSRE